MWCWRTFRKTSWLDYFDDDVDSMNISQTTQTLVRLPLKRMRWQNKNFSLQKNRIFPLCSRLAGNNNLIFRWNDFADGIFIFCFSFHGVGI